MIVLYTTKYCGFCLAAKRLLAKKGLAYEEIDVSFDDEKRGEMVARANGARTVPQIFIQDRHVGGYMELAALDKTGELDAWLGAMAAPESGGELV